VKRALPVVIALLLAVAVLLVGPTRPAAADDARPASLVIREEEPRVFHVRWQTPVRGTAQLRLQPQLPPGAVPIEGTYERTLLGDSLVETWRFRLEGRGGLEGLELGVAGGALSTRTVVVTISLRSGAVHRAILAGRRASFVVPVAVLTEKPDLWQRAQTAIVGGWRLGLHWSHLLFAFLLVLAGGVRALGWGLGAFLLADIVGRLVPMDRPLASFGLALVALAAMLAAREAWLGRRARVVGLAALAGLAHGLTTAQTGDLGQVISAAIGTDGAHLTIGLAALLLFALRRGRLLSLVGGVAASALAVSLATVAPVQAAPAPAVPLSPMALVAGEADASPEATPTAATTDVEGLDLFLDVSVFETRVEVLARYEVLRRWLGLPFDDSVIVVAAQPALLQGAQDAARERIGVRIDGVPATPRQVRAAFTTRDATGVYLREAPKPESITEARVGLVLVFPTAAIPTAVVVDVADLPPDAATRARVLDPEVSRDAPLSADAPQVTWRNDLRSDPLPPIEALDVRRVPVRVPLLSVLLLLGAVASSGVFYRRAPGARLAVLRYGLFLALLVAPVGAVALPGLAGAAPTPTEAEQRAITGTLLDNLYRAFNERGEEEVYDRLALSLTGDQLEGAYVENRRTLAAQRLGGMRTRVDVVEVRAFEGLEAREDGGFRARVTWTVAGSVTHFGHRHLRRNRYDAVLDVAPLEGAWKIRDFDLRSTERVK